MDAGLCRWSLTAGQGAAFEPYFITNARSPSDNDERVQKLPSAADVFQVIFLRSLRSFAAIQSWFYFCVFASLADEAKGGHRTTGPP
jgi:hypothetical protein